MRYILQKQIQVRWAKKNICSVLCLINNSPIALFAVLLHPHRPFRHKLAGLRTYESCRCRRRGRDTHQNNERDCFRGLLRYRHERYPCRGPNDLVLGVPQSKLIVLGDAKRPLAWAEAAVLVLDADGLASFDACRERKVGSTVLDYSTMVVRRPT